ncbi:4-hydroxy-tetrahydrodipicolinate reductase [Candidatus Glomeribacter gigasporarum]|nr:4-hydroxy-tetrahydrodipicolinate reductase [Candidatus Glomeribacter gigasporarum]
MPALKIAISGISGRMGQILVQAALEDRSVQLAGALARAGSEWTGRDAGARFGQTTGVAVSEDIEAGLAKVEYLIDFTSAEYTLACLPVARRHGIKLVIGTTGFSEQQRAGIEIASRALPIVLAPNMSMGVNLYLKLIETAARLFKDRYDIEIIEAHHRHKADAPSGTALKMGEIIARATGCDLSKMSVCGRTPITGARKPLEIGFSAIRGGDIVGDHTVLFAGEGERIELTHRSSSRASYALGALRAVHFLADKTSGLFDMQDVLGLR